MLKYIKDENLKCRRLFAKKMIFIAPLLMLMMAVTSGKYFVQNGYNWWYVLILPGYVTLITVLVNQNEEKKLGYRAVFALPVSLRKIWTAKVMLIGIYIAAACVIHMTGIILGMLTYNTAVAIKLYQVAAATAILIAASLWQVPFCLFLSKKFSMLAAILINLGCGTVLGFFAVSKTFWWICPYSWIARLMCPVLGILPNGILAERGDVLLNPGVIPLGIILSIALFILLLIITANWFSKQEVK